MEAVILKLKESIIYLSTCLNEERLQNQIFRKLSEEKLEQEIFKLNIKHADELADRVVRNNKEKEQMEKVHRKLLIQVKEDSEVLTRKLQADYSLLQASFKNYRFEVRDEMNTVIMFKMKDFLKTQSDLIRGELKKKELEMEEKFEKRMEQTMSKIITKINYMMDDNRKDLHLMKLEYENGGLSFQLRDILPVDDYSMLSSLTYNDTASEDIDGYDTDIECTKCRTYQAQIKLLQEKLQNLQLQQKEKPPIVETICPTLDNIPDVDESETLEFEKCGNCEDMCTSTTDLDNTTDCVEPKPEADEILQYRSKLQELQKECKMLKVQGTRYYDQLQREQLYRKKAEQENIQLKDEMAEKIDAFERELNEAKLGGTCDEEVSTVGGTMKSRKSKKEDDLRTIASCITEEDDDQKAVRETLKLPAINMDINNIKPFQNRTPQVPYKQTVSATPLPRRKPRYRVVELELVESAHLVDTSNTILARSGSTLFGTNIYLAPSLSKISTNTVLTGRLDRNIKLNDANQIRASLVNLPDVQQPSETYRSRFFPQRESSIQVRRDIPRTQSAPISNNSVVKHHVLDTIVSNTMRSASSTSQLNVGKS